MPTRLSQSASCLCRSLRAQPGSGPTGRRGSGILKSEGTVELGVEASEKGVSRKGLKTPSRSSPTAKGGAEGRQRRPRFAENDVAKPQVAENGV